LENVKNHIDYFNEDFNANVEVGTISRSNSRVSIDAISG